MDVEEEVLQLVDHLVEIVVHTHCIGINIANGGRKINPVGSGLSL